MEEEAQDDPFFALVRILEHFDVEQIEQSEARKSVVAEHAKRAFDDDELPHDADPRYVRKVRRVVENRRKFTGERRLREEERRLKEAAKEEAGEERG